MHWLIIEDGIQSRRGHWFGYLNAFVHGLASEGDKAQVYVCRDCELDTADLLNAKRVLPKSIWARMSDDAPKWKKLLRVPAHGLATYQSVSKLLREREVAWDLDRFNTADQRQAQLIVFVPTVLVHHLVGWIPLIYRKFCRNESKVILFFPNTPIHLDTEGKAVIAKEPSANLFRWCIRRLADRVAEGVVVLGAETRSMAKALTEVTGVPFNYLPHPIRSTADDAESSGELFLPKKRNLILGAYGMARADKCSGFLMKGIRLALEKDPELPVKFVVQWVKDYRDEHGRLVACDPWLRHHPKVEIIDEYFDAGVYQEKLSNTDVMMLPYGSDYRLRVSRVLIESIAAGIPVIVNRTTTLAEQAREFGSPFQFDDGSVQGLAQAIKLAAMDFGRAKAEALERAPRAREHFSVRTFRQRATEYSNG